HRKLILAKVSSSRNVGLSRGCEEGKNSSSPELATSLNSETEKEPKKHLPELLTARCVTNSNSSDLNASRTPSEPGLEKGGEQVIEGPQEVVELAMGAIVKVQQPGSDVDGVQTRVTGKATDEDGRLLYRLEHRAEGKPLMLPGDCLVVIDEKPTQGVEGVIRVTAAQLLQVLGKACPFVGPGLWTVKRKEVSPLAWRQLMQLVGEG
ncbi:MAG: hypothetical protein AAFR18_20240, partial [Cyanobacteria bacterium J06627_32]